MAGASSNYAVDGISFSSIQAAIVQIIIDEDGADTTTEISIDVTVNTSETVTLPTNAQVKTTGQFPLRINGDGLSTLTGHILFAASGCRYFRINDMTIAATGGNFNLNGNATSEDQHLYITDCTLTNTNQPNIRDFGRVYINNSSLANTSVHENIETCLSISAIDSKFDSVIGNLSLQTGNTALYLENCALKCTGAFNIEQRHVIDNLIHCVNCSFTQADSIIELDISDDRHGVRMNLFGCVFDNFTNIIKYTNAADSDHLRIKGAPLFMRHNILSNQTGTAVVNFLNGGSTMTLAALQTAGMDSSSKAFNVTFTSTTITSADFLKHDSGDNTDLLFVNPTGVETDAFGTARTAGPISAGIFEPSAVASATTRVWGAGSGAGTDGLFSTKINWTGDIKPGAGDTIQYDASVVINCRLDEAMSIAVIDMQAGFTGTIDGLTDSLNHTMTSDITFAGNRVDMGNGTWKGGGDFANRDSTVFNRDSSTLVLNGNSKTITTNKNRSLNNVTIDGSYTLSSATTQQMTIKGALLINAGKSFTLDDLLVPETTTTVFGTLSINATRTLSMAKSTADLLVKAGGTVDGAGTNAMSLGAKISEQSGTYSVATTTTRRTETITGGTYGGTWTHSSNGAGHCLTFGTGAGQKLIFTGASNFDAEDFDLNVDDNLQNPDVEFRGNVTLTESGAGGTLSWNQGTGKVILAPTSGTQVVTTLNKGFEDTVVDAPGATVQFADNFTADSIVHQDGTLDYNAKAITAPNLSAFHPGVAADMTGVALVVSDDLVITGEADSHYPFKGTGSWTMNVTGQASAVNADVGFCDPSAGSDFIVLKGTDSGNNNAAVIFSSGTPVPPTPSAPTLSTAVASSGQVVLTFTAADEANTINAVYRIASGLNAWVDAGGFTRVGSGAVTITGLTDETTYEFSGYEDDLTCQGPFSNTLFATPTAGSNSPIGPMSLPLENLRDLVAESARFQTLVGVGSAVDAKNHIYLVGVDGSAISGNRPFCIISTGAPWDRDRQDSDVTFLPTGSLLMAFDIDVASSLQSTFEDAAFAFMNEIGTIIVEMEAKAGVNGAFAVRRFSQVAGPERSERHLFNSEGDFYTVTFEVFWGI